MALLRESGVGAMAPRIQHGKVAPQGLQAAKQLNDYVKQCDLEPSLLDLINVRASQINGCAFCIDVHTREARASGESEQRLYALTAWRETPFFTDRERAALAWTEAVTLISIDYVPDEVYDQAREYFSEKELVDLTLAVASINTMNRLSVSFRNPVPGRFPPAPLPSSEDRPSQ
jgi:AhpD family alkylhydroperoxidase